MAEHIITLSELEETNILYGEEKDATADSILANLVATFLRGKLSRMKGDYIESQAKAFDAMDGTQQIDAVATINQGKEPILPDPVTPINP